MDQQAEVCSSCGQRLPPANRLWVGGYLRQKIVDHLMQRPYGMTRAELVDVLYEGHDPGEVSPNSVSVMIHVANTKLLDLGWKIMPASAARNHRYMLEKLETHAAA